MIVESLHISMGNLDRNFISSYHYFGENITGLGHQPLVSHSEFQPRSPCQESRHGSENGGRFWCSLCCMNHLGNHYSLCFGFLMCKVAVICPLLQDCCHFCDNTYGDSIHALKSCHVLMEMKNHHHFVHHQVQGYFFLLGLLHFTS